LEKTFAFDRTRKNVVTVDATENPAGCHHLAGMVVYDRRLAAAAHDHGFVVWMPHGRVYSTAMLEQDEDDGAADVEDEPQEEQTGDAIYFRLLTAANVAGLLSMDELIEAMDGALRQFSAGAVEQPVRTVVPLADQKVFAVMPAFVRVPAVVGAKLVNVFGPNAALNLPTHLATILLFSPNTGALVSMMDGRVITEMRTAAVSALSARELARDDAQTLAIIGSGAQARSHLEAMERVFELKEIRVWSPNPDHQMAFITEMSERTDTKIVGSNSAEEAVHRADLIVLATSSAEPVIQNDWVASGSHVISIGACRPTQREMDPALLRRGRVFVDSRAAALVESGDIVKAIEQGHFTPARIAGELGEVLAGKVKGRTGPEEITIFKSLGLAVEDIVAADLVYRKAIEQDAGDELEL
jgi:alanine dehydrogenase